MDSSFAKSEGEKTSVASISPAVSPTAHWFRAIPFGPLPREFGAFLSTPVRPPPVGALVTSPTAPRPAGNHGVRPPRGGPHVIAVRCVAWRVLCATTFDVLGASACDVVAGVALSAGAPRVFPGWRLPASATSRNSCWLDDDDRCARSDGGCPCRSQPRRGPGEPGPSPAPGRLGAGWARSLVFDLARAAPEEVPLAGPRAFPSAWPCSCLLAATTATGVPAHAAAVVAPSSTGASPCSPIAADTTAASAAAVTGAGDADNATSANCSGAAPGLVSSASDCAAQRVAAGEAEPPSKAAAEPPAGAGSADVPTAGPSASATTGFLIAAADSISAPSFSPTPPSASAASLGVTCSPVAAPARSEPPGSTVSAVVPTVLLHVSLVQQEVQIGAMQPAEQTAAVAAAEELKHYLPLIGFVPGSPGAALGPGPGALVRLAESAQEDPLDLVAAAASILRWLDGRLCWVLVE
ncbi:unnamed protein product [Closterium sp. NIES-65]|nr:unnamed protein product [Closterium sp. NIES-65]